MDLDQFAHRLVIVYDENVYGALIRVRLQGCVGKAHQSVPVFRAAKFVCPVVPGSRRYLQALFV
jgi:hypothetical protein